MTRAQALLGSLFFATSLALGACQTPHDSAKATGAPSQPAVTEHEAEPSEAQPKTTLAAAIATASKSAPDSKFVGAGFSEQEGKAVYHVVLLGKGVVHIVSIDATDGKQLESQDEALEEEMQKEIDEMLKLDPGVGIEKAIASAVAEIPGSWARAAGMGEHETETCYGVLVMHGDEMKNVLVSMKDGKVLQVTDAEEEEEGEEGMEESDGMEGKEKPEAPAPAPTPTPK